MTAAALLLAMSLTACHTAGPRAVRQGRVGYSEAMARGYNELMLLNLVRLRYRDTPHFLEISQLATEHLLGGSAAAGVVVGNGDADVDLGLGVIYEERPKVVYAPLTGEKFVERLLTPIQLDTLYLLMRSGWSIERVLRLTVRQIGDDLLNAPSADGPTPSYTPQYEDFVAVTRSLRDLQTRRLLSLDVRPAAPPAQSAAAADGDGEPELEYLLRFRDAAGLPEPLRRRVRGDWPASGGVELRLDSRGVVGAGGGAGMALHARSLMGVIYFLSQAVEVPAEHADGPRPLVTRTAVPAEAAAAPEGWPRVTQGCPPEPWDPRLGLDWSHTVLGNLFAVRQSAGRPDPGTTFVAVHYRGHWFYIPDCDLQSKSTFQLLTQLFELQSGDPKERATNVILSLGG